MAAVASCLDAHHTLCIHPCRPLPSPAPPLQYADLPDEDEDGSGAKAPRPQGGDAQKPAAEQQGGENGGAGEKKRAAQAAALEAAQEKAKKAKEAKPAGWFELKINTNV